MLKWLLFTSLFASACMAGLIGAEIPPYPNDSKASHGVCISGAYGYEYTCQNSLEVLEIPEGNPASILSLTLLRRNSEGKAIWLVVDEIPYPTIVENQSLAIGTCQISEKFDSSLLAVVEHEDTEWLKASGWARIVNLATGQFSEISPTNVECVNEGWGL